MAYNDGNVSISNISANAAVWAPGEEITISFKVKNVSGQRIDELGINICIGDENGTAVWLHGLAKALNIAAGKSKSFSTTFIIDGDNSRVEQYFEANPTVRAKSICIDYYASLRVDGGVGTTFEIPDLKVINHRFTPQITEMNLVRAKDGVPNDEGENVLTTLKLGVNTGNYDYTRFMAAKIYTNQGGEATTADSYIDITGSIPSLFSGAVNNPDLIPGTYDKAYDWDFLLVFGDEYEAFYGRFNLGMAFANLHLSGVSTGGACFGGFCTSSYKKPKLESHYPIYAYKGIAKLGEDWNRLTPLAGTTPAEFGGGQLRCRKVENKCIVEGSLMVKPGSSTLVLAALPDGYTPEKGVFSINACEGGRVARIVVGGSGEENAGKLCMSWVKNLTDGSNYTAEAIWVQCSIEYWVEAPEDDVVSTANLIDSTGAIVTDVTGREIAVRSAGGKPYQSIYTGKQIDDGITAANNAASRTYVDDKISKIELIPGDPGKSAYEYAQEGGYEGTEEEFAADLGKVGDQEGAITSWDDIPDKPFGGPITGTATIDGDTLKWDGDFENMPISTGTATNGWVYVSDNVPTANDVQAGYEFYIVNKYAGGTEYQYNVPPTYYDNGNIYFGDIDVVCAYIAAEPTASHPRPGVYFRTTIFSHTSRMKIAGFTWTQSDEVAPIPKDMLPEDNAYLSDVAAAESRANANIAEVNNRFEDTTIREIKFTDNVADRLVVSDAITGNTFAHVTYDVPAASLVEGGYELTVGGETYSRTGLTDKGDGYYNLMSAAWVIARDNLSVTIGGNTTVFPKKGTYFMVSGNNKITTALTSAAMQAQAAKLALKAQYIPALPELILQSPDGKKFRITIDNNGNLVPTEI